MVFLMALVGHFFRGRKTAAGPSLFCFVIALKRSIIERRLSLLDDVEAYKTL